MSNPLRDVGAWFELTPRERLELITTLAAQLGDKWQFVNEGTEPHVRLLHTATASTFLLVPGGTLQMGLLESEIALVRRYVGSRPHVLEQIREFQQYAAPVREVQVSPFLCGERLLKLTQVRALSPQLEADADPLGALHRPQALTLCQEHGFRLPSDAELEWLARQGHGAPFILDAVFEAAEDDEEHILITGQPVVPRFGIGDLFETQWAADDWFPDHEDRPLSSVARSGGDTQGVRRFEEFDFKEVGPEAVISELSARRDPGRDWRAGVRLALDLPASFSNCDR